MPIDSSRYRALILAAGSGRRLGPDAPPKALLKFGGSTLLARHLRILAACGVRDVAITVGYCGADVRAEAVGVAREPQITMIENPYFQEGSVFSLWQARSVLRSGASVILMDADVLYDQRLLRCLLDSTHENCFLLDRAIDAGEEPVKLCVANGSIVDFHKRPRLAYDWHGESVGFFRFSPDIAAELASRVDDYVSRGRTDMEYEEPIRDMLLAHNSREFGFEDISGLPWIEIDFPEDVERAQRSVLPYLLT